MSDIIWKVFGPIFKNIFSHQVGVAETPKFLLFVVSLKNIFFQKNFRKNFFVFFYC